MAKRLLVAYGLWALGGPLGLHQLYLGRASHALLWLLTLGGFGAAWLGDFWLLPGWVADANGQGASRERRGAVPALSPLRLAGQLAVGLYFGLVVVLELPWLPTLLAQPLAVGLGVLLVASVGNQTTEAPSTLAVAFLVSFLCQGRLLAPLATSVAASSVAQWHRRYKPPRQGPPPAPLATWLCPLALVWLLFATLLAVRVATGLLGTLLALPRAALRFLLLPFRAIWLLAEGLGLTGGSWAGEAHDIPVPALCQVLGVPVGSSAAAIHRSYREQLKLWHPDHNRHRPEEAQKRFLELQEAYEELAGPRR
ncbi:DJC22 protein, partial [Rhinopomastus cyanomelas]|nr:DJC22 protein [Rhinopomastus cyanomelas]